MTPFRSPRPVAAALAGTALALALAAPSVAGTAKAGPIDVEQAWARATPSHAPSAVTFLTLANHGRKADALIKAAAPSVAGTTQLHVMRMRGSIMEMREVAKIALPAGRTVTMAPGGNGYHLMMMGLKGPLKAGEHFPLTLTFRHAGTTVVDVAVSGIGAMAPGGAPMTSTPMGGMPMKTMPGMK
jgi:copper(I)-binding protein